MTIRKYTPADKTKVIELFRLNTPKYFSPIEEDGLIDYLANYSDNYFVAEEDNMIVGSAGFNLSEDRKTGKLSWDIIHPGSHGKGIGTILTKYRIQRLKEIKSVEIISVRTSQLVYKFYEKFGLELREVVNDYWAPGFDLYRLDKPINEVKS